MPDIETILKERVIYDPVSGFLTWSVDCGKATKGSRAEHRSTNGYLQVAITYSGKRHKFLSHRVAWLLQKGSWPEKVLDHIDCNRQNNAWGNLRDCSQSQNTARKKMPARLLPRGVTYAGHTNKRNPYMAQCKGKCIGYFPTPELAASAYEQAFSNEFGTEWRN